MNRFTHQRQAVISNFFVKPFVCKTTNQYTSENFHFLKKNPDGASNVGLHISKNMISFLLWGSEFVLHTSCSVLLLLLLLHRFIFIYDDHKVLFGSVSK